jgi:hypothetical protein
MPVQSSTVLWHVCHCTTTVATVVVAVIQAQALLLVVFYRVGVCEHKILMHNSVSCATVCVTARLR